MRSKLLFFSCIVFALNACNTVRWPYAPGNTEYDIGNNYGEYQNYGGAPYYHDGLDILGGAPRAMFAVAAGTVTHITDNGGGLYCGIMIGSPTDGGNGWLYWHVDSPTIAVNVGDVVAAGDYIGDIVNWPVANFHHVHFSKVRGTGGYPWAWYTPTDNPLRFLSPDNDPNNPVISNAGGADAFLFCENETSNYLPANDLSGQVDVIALIRDKFDSGASWDLAPYIVKIKIVPLEGGAAVLDKTSVRFRGALGNAATVVNAVYKNDAVANSEGNYNTRDFYFVTTNTDGDLVIEASDNNESWDTTAVPNGPYVVTVTACDCRGREDAQSMRVTVDN